MMNSEGRMQNAMGRYARYRGNAHVGAAAHRPREAGNQERETRNYFVTVHVDDLAQRRKYPSPRRRVKLTPMPAEV